LKGEGKELRAATDELPSLQPPRSIFAKQTRFRKRAEILGDIGGHMESPRDEVVFA